MANERLRAVMETGGWTHAALADITGVDPKSVERWVNLGRTPRRATALQAAEALGEDVHALWPALRQARAAAAVSPELVALYGQRADLPVSVFVELLSQARQHIDVLVYAAVFLHEAYPRLNDLLRERADDGCAIRVAVGDADAPNVQQRGREERFGHGIESRCRLAFLHYQPLADVPGIELRTHGTTLYNSVYRADDHMLVNAHVWGVNAYGAPVWHLRRHSSGGMFDTYAGSFDAVWQNARPMEG
ncbi:MULTISPECIES: helix-turn-helix transcriptional regulator [unclassified Streptomyces]|uniref:helix-turn-helix domain-containing protein n=1 Tax=unclassified Streptomyces TaxID=2593676 RepID=UPI00070059F0|nr:MULTISPECIES: helix-turn-helix transcriptional regulator [unclassified Streptomyces]KQX59382.1 XRE family transcriptional regulator [Streptomyces sp. Root1304]KRB00643.1 XRE family transcriptional regulator [Streptomyces sp. Root66D1]